MAKEVLDQLETLNGSLTELDSILQDIHRTLMRNSDVLVEVLQDIRKELTFISTRVKR